MARRSTFQRQRLRDRLEPAEVLAGVLSVSAVVAFVVALTVLLWAL